MCMYLEINTDFRWLFAVIIWHFFHVLTSSPPTTSWIVIRILTIHNNTNRIVSGLNERCAQHINIYPKSSQKKKKTHTKHWYKPPCLLNMHNKSFYSLKITSMILIPSLYRHCMEFMCMQSAWVGLIRLLCRMRYIYNSKIMSHCWRNMHRPKPISSGVVI